MDEFKKTRIHPEVIARHRAVAAVRPFLDRFGSWQTRAAHLAALDVSHLQSDDERRAQREARAELIIEVEIAAADFHRAIDGHPPHSRIDDVDGAFRRLLAKLRDEWPGEAPAEAQPSNRTMPRNS